ncbi:MAG: tetratricopeptide repeat protein [Planctomycetota bacterium]|nr:tetratricopeptide repeat protein [Planctomycetota bacterium]MDA1215063.1 tetratricopeptide repeat protein [Planctomycetota bacterium]
MSATDSLFHQAIQVHQAGRFDDAAALYQQILATSPHSHRAWHLLGVAAYQAQKPQEAIECIGTAIGLCETEVTYHRHLAAAYVVLEAWTDARHTLETVNRLAPGEFETCLQLGQVLTRLHDWDEAANYLEHAVKLSPQQATAWQELGRVREHQGRLHEARCAWKQSLQLVPSNPSAWNQLGTLWQAEEHFAEALDCYRSALERDPHFAAAWANCGSVCQLLGNTDEAANYYDRALLIDPRHLNAWNNRGVILKHRGAFDEARACFDRCLSIQSDYADAHWNRSLITLQQGNFRDGWDEYSWRWRTPSFGEPTTNFPPWGGPATNAGHVWIFAEQGLGDEIQFAGCFADLVAQNIPCTIECDRRLRSIFERSFPSLRFVSRPVEADIVHQLPAETVQTPLGDLPRWFRSDEPSFPRHQGYLVADATLRTHWRERLNKDRDAFHIGISWRGGKDPIARQQRSTTLSDWAGLFQLEGIRWWNLQHGSCRDEWEAFCNANDSTAFSPTPQFDPLHDQESLAGLIAELDLIISIDNAVVHLAGALGRPTWVLLPEVSDWRWLLDRNDSPWYPSLRLFRQTRSNDWSDLFRRVASLLSERSII